MDAKRSSGPTLTQEGAPDVAGGGDAMAAVEPGGPKQPEDGASAQAKLVRLRPPFPVDYREQEPITVLVAPDCAGVVVVMPDGLDENNKLEFRIALFVGRAAGKATFVPRGRGMMIFDIEDGFELTPANLTPVVTEEWMKGGGRPTGSKGVGGHP